MKKIDYEFSALIIGLILNFVSTFVGFIFFIQTHSNAILLDAVISLILFLTTIISMIVSNTVNKKESKKYPLGRYAIENMFLLFRSLMMIGTVMFSIVDSFFEIFNFFIDDTEVLYDATNIQLIVYGILMTSLCFAITIVYYIFSKKKEGGSEILRLEFKASIYDGLVSFCAISCLLIFANVEILKPIAPIADSILVIILSILYTFAPSKEMIGQVKVLIDQRRDEEEEKGLLEYLKNTYQDYNFNDLYYSNSGNTVSIYVTLDPKEDRLLSEIMGTRDQIYEYLYSEYPDSKIYLLFDERKIHKI